MATSQPGRATGTTNELAKERNRGAAERTLTAWIGYCLGLISVGVAFDQIVVALQRRFPTADPGVTVVSARWIGLALIVAAIALLAIALIQHRLAITAIEREDYVLLPIAHLNRIAVGAVLLFGALALVVIVLSF